MIIHRMMAAAALAALVVSPALAANSSAESESSPSDSAYATNLDNVQIRCYDLMAQFDNAVHGMKATKTVRNAKMLRMKGARQCAAEEDIYVARQGPKTLEHALNEIGQKPKPAA